MNTLDILNRVEEKISKEILNPLIDAGIKQHIKNGKKYCSCNFCSYKIKEGFRKYAMIRNSKRRENLKEILQIKCGT